MKLILVTLFTLGSLSVFAGGGVCPGKGVRGDSSGALVKSGTTTVNPDGTATK